MATQFQPLLPRFRAKDLTLDTDRSIHRLLREAGKDHVMHSVQDAFFDKRYWIPSCNAAAKCGLTMPLSTAVVYDSRIHGNFELKSLARFGIRFESLTLQRYSVVIAIRVERRIDVNEVNAGVGQFL